MANDLPFLAEHQAPDADDVSTHDMPVMTDEQEQAVKLFKKLLDKAKNHRSRYDKKWLDNYKMFRGDQWKRRRPSYRHSEVVNLIFQAIQSMVPEMTETRPKSYFLPTDPSDLEFATYLNDAYTADWQDGKWLLRLTEALFDGHFYGIGYGKLWHNPRALFGLGRIQYKSADPFNQFPDPDTVEINDEDTCTYWIEADPMDVEKARSLFCNHPFKGVIKPDLLDLTENSIRTSVDRELAVRNTDRKMPYESFGQDANANQGKVMVYTLYMKPSDIVEEEKTERGENGEDTVLYVKRKRYPKGRKIVVINDYLFEDNDRLDNDDGRFPFQRYVNYILPREFYGMSEIEQLEGPQMIFNKVVSFVLDVLTLTGNPIWLIPTSSGVKPGSFHSAPGMQVPYDGDVPPRVAEGAQLQPFVMQIIDRLENWFNSLSGSPEVSRGIAPGSVTAASAIDQLMDSARTRTKQKMRNLDMMMIEMGQQWVGLALQHYTAPRIMRMTGQDGADKYFRMHVEHVYQKDAMGGYLKDESGERVPMLDEKGDPVRKAIIRPYTKDPVTDQMILSDKANEYLIRGAFDVRVETTSGLPFNKTEKESRLLQLFDRQIIDRRTVLKEIEFPAWEEIDQRMEAQQQAQMAAQQGG